jgi:hypothetical protein
MFDLKRLKTFYPSAKITLRQAENIVQESAYFRVQKALKLTIVYL